MRVRRSGRAQELLRLLALAALPWSGCRPAATTTRDSGGLAPASSRTTIYRRGAVAADHPVASEAGLAMLRRGGNAVDAAVATSFTLSVVRPYSCGLGGGGFMLIHQGGEEGQPPRQVALDYRETAPAAVDRDYYVRLDDDHASRFGVHASGVPGTVAGLLHALEHHGRLDRATVLEPAIRAAEEGFPADTHFVEAAGKLSKALQERPDLVACAGTIWTNLAREGRLRVGDRVENPQQAHALRLIAEHGADAFYRGAIADAIVQAMRSGGGPIEREDLEGYRVRVTAPLRGSFRGHTVLAMPPPSSGGIATLQILTMLERRWPDLRLATRNDARYVHLVTEAMKHAFADRAQWLADASYVDVPVARLLDRVYLDELADGITLEATCGVLTYGSVEPAPVDGGTSHLSVIDADGMAVACTETINLVFGSIVEVPGYGFMLNNEMDDFTTVPGQPNAFGLRQSDRNLPEPGKRPLSSMSPTILLAGDRPVLIAGASGGPRIITGTLQTILNCLVFDLPPEEAVAAARFHHQWVPEVLRLEQGCVDEATAASLRSYGHELGPVAGVGDVQVILINGQGILAASDPRKGGRPAGY
jgi:gamma-glutamyltranspeptidase/glutathione hydrolase